MSRELKASSIDGAVYSGSKELRRNERARREKRKEEEEEEEGNVIVNTKVRYFRTLYFITKNFYTFTGFIIFFPPLLLLSLFFLCTQNEAKCHHLKATVTNSAGYFEARAGQRMADSPQRRIRA